MKILLTGATGFIGKSLSKSLVNNGHEVIAWVRNPAKAKTILDAQIKCYKQLEDIPDRQLDAVINLAGEPIADKRWSASRKLVLRNSRIDLTYKLNEFINSLDHQPKVVLSGSAVGYYGSQASEVSLDEHAECVEGFTHSLCADWETAAMSFSSETTRVCLLRTGIVLGKDGGVLRKMLLPFKLALGGPMGDGQQMMSWIHLRDWINATLFLLTNDTLSGPFNLVSPNPVNNKMFTKVLAKVLHRPAKFRLPCFGLKLAMGEAAELLCEGQRVIPKKLLDAGFEFEFSHVDQALIDIVKS